MRYVDIIKDKADPVVQMAQDRLKRSVVKKDKNQLKVKQAQERKLNKDITNKQRLNIGETDPDLTDEITDDLKSIHADEIGLDR